MSTYEIGSIVFDKWKICRELGQGSYGTVYEIQREDFGGVYKAALKVITVPQSRTELQSVLDEGMTPPQAKQYFITSSLCRVMVSKWPLMFMRFATSLSLFPL